MQRSGSATAAKLTFLFLLSTAVLLYVVFFKKITQYNAYTYNARTFSLWTHVHKPYPYKHLLKTEPADHEIHEVTRLAVDGDVAYRWKHSAAKT